MNKAWILLLFAVTCAEQKPPAGAAGPQEAVQAFAEAAQKGDTVTAWSLLSESTRHAADEAAARARAASGRSSPEGGRELLFGSALPEGPLGTRLLSQEGTVARVRTIAPDGGAGAEFRVVQETGRWRIDLPLGR